MISETVGVGGGLQPHFFLGGKIPAWYEARRAAGELQGQADIGSSAKISGAGFLWVTKTDFKIQPLVQKAPNDFETTEMYCKKFAFRHDTSRSLGEIHCWLSECYQNQNQTK